MFLAVITVISIQKRFKVRGTMMGTLRSLREKIESLESEKTELKAEIERLRKEAEGKAVALECEVAVLREEAESLKEMIDSF
jgi:predicted  nucleic acid-binding Zn-ribbon protein